MCIIQGLEMADNHTPEIRSYNMSRIHSTDTKPEIYVRKRLFAAGFRYRKNDRRYPGAPDIVLPKYKTVIFIHGCFWHMHEGHTCFKMPKSRLEYWVPKLEGNRQRDIKNQESLRQMGWNVIVIWECMLKKSVCEETISSLIQRINSGAVIT